MKKRKAGVLLLVLWCTGGVPFVAAADIVFDPWNKAENAFTAAKMAEAVGLTSEQLMQLKKTVDLSIQILSQATWIHDAVTGSWSIDAHVQSWVEQRVQLFIAQNVPSRYRDLVRAAIDHRILEYFRGHRARYPVLTVPELDPWNPNSRLSQYYQDAQATYDASHAIAEQTYDGTAVTLRNLQMLQKQLPQPDVNASVNVLSQIALEHGVTMADWIRANAAHEKARAHARSSTIEARRQWMHFLGVTDPHRQYGYILRR